MLRDDQIERYARHILLREVGGVGQERILGASVSLEGLGAVGCWAASYLALAGVGRLRLRDPRGVPAGGVLPILPVRHEGSRRSDALVEELRSFNPDVAIEASGVDSRLQTGRTAGDLLLARIDGEAHAFAALASGLELRTGWGPPLCPSCAADALSFGGEPSVVVATTAADPATAALAGSLAAGAILAAILDPDAPREGWRSPDAEGAPALPACDHR